MLIQLCKELDFPSESLPILENGYLTVKENPEAYILFETALESLLHPNEIVFNETTAKIAKISSVHPYTLNMLLCISSLKPLRKMYEEAGKSKVLEECVGYLKPRLLSCKKDSDVWGIKDGFWQWMFHELNCVTLGRLEYEPFHHFCDTPYKRIKKGDPVILIHIPRGKSLEMDEVTESLASAYAYFKDRFENETVPFMTHSWLLYPPFFNGVFKEGGNIQRFASLFDIISENTAGFQNFPNVFGCPYPGEDLSRVPKETSLQRNMLNFIMQGNVMGEGYGIFLYGKNGIVKEQ